MRKSAAVSVSQVSHLRPDTLPGNHANTRKDVHRDVSETPENKRKVKVPGVIDQIRTATKAENRLASVAGAIMGGFVPIATFLISHNEVALSVHGIGMLLLVIGGLVFSAKTVWQWANMAFASDAWKATGFVILLEGVMTLSGITGLSIAALVLLTAVNGIATGVILSQQR